MEYLSEISDSELHPQVWKQLLSDAFRFPLIGAWGNEAFANFLRRLIPGCHGQSPFPSDAHCTIVQALFAGGTDETLNILLGRTVLQEYDVGCSTTQFPEVRLWIAAGMYATDHSVNAEDAFTYRPFVELLSEVFRTMELMPRDALE